MYEEKSVLDIAMLYCSQGGNAFVKEVSPRYEITTVVPYPEDGFQLGLIQAVDVGEIDRIDEIEVQPWIQLRHLRKKVSWW